MFFSEVSLRKPLEIRPENTRATILVSNLKRTFARISGTIFPMFNTCKTKIIKPL